MCAAALTLDPPRHARREQQRLDALSRYDVLDTGREETFDRVTRLIQRLFRVPIATIAFVDGHRQWFKSRQGLEASEVARGPALCDRVILQGTPLVVPDTWEDDRFRSNPFVTGAPHLRFYAGVPLRAPESGATIGTLCAMDVLPRSFDAADLATLGDFAQVVMDLLELRVQARHDGLTGTLSRRAFRAEGEHALALARRHGHDLACLTLDIDHFKSVNDRHGHAVGDEVLKAVAEACRSQLRETDLLGRLGGEEFGALLMVTDVRGARDVAQRLRAAVAGLRVPTEAGPIAVTVSLGVAAVDRGPDSLDALLARADAALYEAKAEGRNRCAVWRLPGGTVPGPRRRVLKAGRIVFNTGRSTIDCTVRAMSDTDASLDVVSTGGIPQTFKLQIDADGVSRLCRVLAASERRLEVAFQERPRDLGVSRAP